MSPAALVAMAMLLLFAPFADTMAAETRETRQARVGDLLILKFEGNRAGGYRWRLNKETSRGLEIVDVKLIGWTIIDEQQQSFFFRKLPVMSIAVRVKEKGEAEIAFDYYRNWGARQQSKTRVVRVVAD